MTAHKEMVERLRGLLDNAQRRGGWLSAFYNPTLADEALNALPTLLDALSASEARAAAAEGECERLMGALEKAAEANHRLLQAVLRAIETRRSEPLAIVEDQLRNHLARQALSGGG